MQGSLRRLFLGSLLSGFALASSASAQRIETLADRLGDLDRFTSSEDAAGLDTFRFDQRNWYDFDILFAAVLADETLVPAVTSADTAVTLFAPNDRAFQLLALNLTGRWFLTEGEVLGAIVGLVEAGAVDLTNVLTYQLGVTGGRVIETVPAIG